MNPIHEVREGGIQKNSIGSQRLPMNHEMIIPKSALQEFFDRSSAPVARVSPGSHVTFETVDAIYGKVRSVEQFLEWRRVSRHIGNPITGPVFVEGAKPGDTLVVDIVSVELDEDGFQLLGPDRAIIRDEVTEWSCLVFKVKGPRLVFPNGLELPARPVIGCFGNAPAGQPTCWPNRLGGNQDNPAVCVGARLYIPVEVEGALFSLGDVHGCQGDGEVVGAPEIGAKVTVRFQLLQQAHSEWFMIEDAENWYSSLNAPTEAEAARRAVLHNARFIEKAHGIRFEDALIFLTLSGRLSISRTGKWGRSEPVVCSSFSKQTLQEAFKIASKPGRV